MVAETTVGDVRGQEGFFHYRQFSAVDLAQQHGREDTLKVLSKIVELPDTPGGTIPSLRTPIVFSDAALALKANAIIGSGQLSVNAAQADELINAGVTKAATNAIVSWRAEHASFDAVDDVLMKQSTFMITVTLLPVSIRENTELTKPGNWKLKESASELN